MHRKCCMIAVSLLMIFSGCSRTEREELPVSGQIQLMKESVQETEPFSVAERAEAFAPAEEVHIYDECAVLSEKETELYNNYLEWISRSRLLCTALVVTENLNGQTPDIFAKSYYQNKFGEENPDGFLIVINNDTYQDYVYTAGTCQHWMPQTEITSALAQATPALIEKRYADALERILPLGENVPAFVFDRTGTLTDAEQMEFSSKIQQIQEKSGKQCAVLLISFPDKEPETLINAWKEKINADSLLIIDPKKKQCQTESDTLTEEILSIWEEKSLSWAIRHFFEKIQK